MKKASFTVKKWIVRMLVTVGGVLGFASCHHSGDSRNEDSKGSSTMMGSPSAVSTRDVSEVEPAPCVYGPPPELENGEEPVEIDPVVDVYGPPVIVDPQEPVEIATEQ